MVDSTAKWTGAIKNINGYDVSYFAFDFGPKPYNTGDGMRDIADWAEQQGVEIFYSTPAMEPGPASKSCCTLEPQASSIFAPAQTIIFWPSPVLFCSLR